MPFQFQLKSTLDTVWNLVERLESAASHTTAAANKPKSVSFLTDSSSNTSLLRDMVDQDYRKSRDTSRVRSLQSTEESQETKKVHFSKFIRIYLVPCRNEFDENEMWWKDEEIEKFRNESHAERGKHFVDISESKLKDSDGTRILVNPTDWDNLIENDDSLFQEPDNEADNDVDDEDYKEDVKDSKTVDWKTKSGSNHRKLIRI